MGIDLYRNEEVIYTARRYWGAGIASFFADSDEGQFKRIYLTNSRLVVDYGWFGSESTKLYLEHIYRLEVSGGGFWSWLFSTGEISIETVGHEVFRFKRVNNPGQFVDEFNSIR